MSQHEPESAAVSAAHFEEIARMLERAAKSASVLIRAVWFIVGLTVTASIAYANLVNRVGEIERYGSPELRTFMVQERESRAELTSTLKELSALIRQQQAEQDRRLDKLENRL